MPDDDLLAAVAALDAAGAAIRKALETPPGRPAREDGPLLYDFGEAAALLGVSRSAIFRIVSDGRLTAVEIPGVRGRRIRRTDLEHYVATLGQSRRRLKAV